MNTEIKITPLNVVGQDERGATYDYSLNNRNDFILITRKAGSMSGNTYHTGKSPVTNPKTFVLLTGTIEFSYRHVDTKQHTTVVIDQPSIIEVSPMVTHSVGAVTDMIMLECNSIADIQNDRIREEVQRTVVE